MPLHDTPKRIRLWDLPLRVFHWSLLAAVSTAIATGLAGGGWMTLHGQAGLVIIGLLAFRLVWGVLGSTHARFAHFLPTPSALRTYLKGQWQGVGHNPLGALSVVALLGVLAAQALTGALGNDEIAFTGPLASLVSEERSIALTNLHHQLVNVLYVLLGLHVAAILFHVHVKQDNLVAPMVTGWKPVADSVPTPQAAKAWAFVVTLLVALSAVYGASGVWIPADAAVGEASAVSTDHPQDVAPAGTADTGASAVNRATPSW
ncbi:MAG TPA: cytochrome b/b6 domain-containing protein [Aquabacterium sp.]|nr:cytochrome b/b6 domain-containing protein [Aquabacterium sp.]